ncbi:hypothetical protein BV25DRAFT_1921972 [Artomyces pyxidatus]|uniref:Uncharacterized protein n=1 Tax=Artomyces pyxidatus TaxID=48021 RepID=A0ACB8SFN6_9AGAM|nr:hypothetical protein BV25DRAFT_1921972 [Artomyces pyxidatus]
MFDTGRTIFRPYKDSDLSDLVDLVNDDAEVQSTLILHDYTRLRSHEFTKEFAQATSKDHFMALAWDKETGDFVGQITLMTHRAQPQRRARGRAEEKLARGGGPRDGDHVVDHRIRIQRDEAASRSADRRWRERGGDRGVQENDSGFRVEGVAKEVLWHYGRWIDVLEMAILDREWDLEMGMIREPPRAV